MVSMDGIWAWKLYVAFSNVISTCDLFVYEGTSLEATVVLMVVAFFHYVYAK